MGLLYTQLIGRQQSFGVAVVRELEGSSTACDFSAGKDCLRDEGFAYAEALNKAGVSARFQM